MVTDIPWGPTGQLVYERTYSRTKPDGTKETWPETVERVVDGNLALVPEGRQFYGERDALIRMMSEFKIIPAGRHLWASGVKGRQYLFNCHVSGWDPDPAEHFRFTFLRLMEGGGVGANYSNVHLDQYPDYTGCYNVHIVCSPEHPDYEKMLREGVLSPEFDAEWSGAFPVEDSREGWADALSELLSAYYNGDTKHPDRVFDVSRVRGEGARLMTFGGRASGPLPLARMLHEVSGVMNFGQDHKFRQGPRRLTGLDAMEIDHAIATCVVSGGNRRSARMAIMRWDDPQVHEFIRIKQDSGSHWTTNISVEVDDEFWRDADDPILDAAIVLDEISKGMLANGEPGIWDSTLSNDGEPNPILATNPCGEIPLEPWENCNLGHVNMAAFVDEPYTELHLAHELITRFLIRATYGDVTDPKQAAVLARNRRIGVGHLGTASYLALNGQRYSEAGDSLAEVLSELYDVVWEAATDFADDLRIPVPVKCTTVAPTGTIAKLPGVSEGIHPIYAKFFVRRIRFSDVDEDQRATVDEYRAKGYLVEPCLYAPETTVVAIPTMDSLMADVVERFGQLRADEIVESAGDLTAADMLNMQALYQEHWADNAVSYTVNIDRDRIDTAGLADLLREYGGRIKGATVFPEFGMPQSPYERLTKEEFETELARTGRAEIEDSVDENCAMGGACPVR